MATVYISSINGKINRENNTLIFTDIKQQRVVIFPHLTKELVITGYAEITSYALSCLIYHKINVYFLTKNGMYNATLLSSDQKNVYLRQKQYYLLNDDVFIIKFTRNVVKAKVSNQLNFMKRIVSEKQIPDELRKILKVMKNLLEKLDTSNSVSSIRGIEGIAAKYYFSLLKYNFTPDWVEFNGRIKNPPTDPVNSLLSFTYTILSYKIEAALIPHGLDTYVGYLHSLEYGRKSLVCDLMEEFRTPIAERVTSFLINNKVLSESDFESGKNRGGNANSVFLKKNKLNKVVEYMEKRLDKTIFYLPLNKKISLRNLIIHQASEFKKCISGEIGEYMPVVIK